MNKTVTFCAVLASAFCLGAGTYLLSETGMGSEDAIARAIALYFIGKGFFVGPMLWLAASRSPARCDS